jgi:molecular chaperone GrpE
VSYGRKREPEAAVEDGATGAEEAPVVDAEVVEEETDAGADSREAVGRVRPDGDADEVEQDLASLIEDARNQRDEYLELAQRTKADFENFRKRMAAESAAARVRGRIDVIDGVIEAIDNLERVMAAEEINPDGARQNELRADLPVSVQGVIVAYRDLHATLARAGAEAFDPAGEPFDPNLHEALQAIPAEGVESGLVIEVVQRGYRAEDQVIRPARVIVSR